MLNIKLGCRVPSVQDCCQILADHNARFGIPLDYDRICEYYAYYTMKAEKIYASVARYVNIKEDADFRAWLYRNNIRTGLLTTDGGRGKSGRVSLSEESINAAIATGLYSEERNNVLRCYSEYKLIAHLVAPLRNIMHGYDVSPLETYDGHRMIICHPDWVPQNTGRIGMQNPGLMNIAKVLADIETVPKGWVYLTVDSGQIDPRITQSFYINDPQLKKCTVMYNDAYYGYVHYCTILTDEDRKSGRLDLEPVELSEEMQVKRKRFKTYGNAVMYGSTSNPDNDPYKAAFIRCIGGHPQRIKWQEDVTAKIERGIRQFPTAFGTPIDITQGPSDANYSDKTSDSYIAHLVRCAINNPVQGTAADLMRMSIYEANKILIRECDRSVILRYTHDSGTFAIHESEYDRVADRLSGITSYQVEDWIPIYGDPQVGIKQSGELARFI